MGTLKEVGNTRKGIWNKCEESIEDPKNFYAKDFIKDYGPITGEKNTPITEVIAEFLLKDENLNRLKDIKEDSRHKVNKSYNVHHDGSYPLNANPKNEKIIARDLFNKGPFEHIGEIIDYETPLNLKNDSGYGDIDLLSAIDKNNKKIVYILELKREKTSETFLRCVLEAYTYYKIVGKEDLLADFDKKDYTIIISPLVFKGKESQPYIEWLELKEGKRPFLNELLNKLKLDVDLKPFFISKENDQYIISDK